MLDIPPKYFWPGLVVAILLGSFTMTGITIWYATSGGGPTIVGEARSTEAAGDGPRASDREGWHALAEWEGRDLLVAVQDAQRLPVTDLDGEALAESGGAPKALAPVPNRRGVYRARFQDRKPHRLTLRFEGRGRTFETTLTPERGESR